jgi:hypothetical protein
VTAALRLLDEELAARAGGTELHARGRHAKEHAQTEPS